MRHGSRDDDCRVGIARMIAITPPNAESATTTLDPKITARNKAVAREFAGQFVFLSANDPEFDRKIGHIAAIGKSEETALADLTHAAMTRSLSRDQQAANGYSAMANLRTIVERLHPGGDDKALQPRKFLGLFPSARRQTGYFHRYEVEQGAIEAALSTMKASRDFLLLDTIAVNRLREAMPPLLTKLAESVHLCDCIEQRLEKLATDIDASDPSKADALRRDVLFAARQRHMDLMTTTALAQQSALTLALVTRNNTELVKGIDRATATTIAALRTAIIASQTLTQQGLMLDRIEGLKASGSSLIEAAAVPLEQSAPGDDMAASQHLAALRRALDEVSESVDSLALQRSDHRPV